MFTAMQIDLVLCNDVRQRRRGSRTTARGASERAVEEDNISSHHFRISLRNQGSQSKPDTNRSRLICFILRQLTGWKVFFTRGEWISTKVSGIRSYRSESVCMVSCQRRFSYNQTADCKQL